MAWRELPRATGQAAAARRGSYRIYVRYVRTGFESLPARRAHSSLEQATACWEPAVEASPAQFESRYDLVSHYKLMRAVCRALVGLGLLVPVALGCAGAGVMSVSDGACASPALEFSSETVASADSVFASIQKFWRRFPLSIIVVRSTHRSAFERSSSIDEGERDHLVRERLLVAAKREDIVLAYESGPYHDRREKLSGWRVEIVATDLSKEVLDKASVGLYSQFEVQRGLPIQLLVKHFSQVNDLWQIDPSIRAMVKFQPLNLLVNFSHLGAFDIVFCRNVLIYFEQQTKGDVLDRMAALMPSDGYLFLGGAETVLGICDAFKPMDGYRGIYRLSPQVPH